MQLITWFQNNPAVKAARDGAPSASQPKAAEGGAVSDGEILDFYDDC